MQAQTTIIVSPRDRYSGIAECVQQVIDCTDPPFDLWVLDLGYPARVIAPVRRMLADRPGARIIELGQMIPMDAIRAVRGDIRTDTVVLLDNDSRVTPGWLPPLLADAQPGVAVVSPLTLEREGVDLGATLRNHLCTAELRAVDVGDTTYLIEYKHNRRSPQSELTQRTVPTGTFELHCVMLSTRTLQALELPSAVIREHLDISLQIAARGEKLLAEPKSVVVFDNLGTRMHWYDMRYFWFRWAPRLTRASSDLFAERWGYRFYSERSMYNWVFRRKSFLVARWFHLPIGLANRVTGVLKHIFRRDWDPLPDAEARSRPFPGERPAIQRSHNIYPAGRPLSPSAEVIAS